MEKIEYGDVNRFLVSTGLVLISLSLAVPYFYLSDDFGLYIEQEKVKTFSVTIQTIISDKETIIKTIQKYIPWTSLGLFVTGLGLLVVGLIRWFKRQGKIDERENLDIQKLKLEIDDLTPEEKREKAKVEVQANEIAEIVENKKLTDSAPNPTRELAVSNYLKVEERIINHFKNYKTENFHILDNVKIAGRFWVDILLESKTKEYADRIVEIKFASKTLSYSLITDALSKLDQYLNFYLGFYDRKAVPILIVVFSNKIEMTTDQLRALAQRADSDTSNYKSLKRLQVHFINENQIETFDIKSILRR